jgi:Resolvase, N terminal domain
MQNRFKQQPEKVVAQPWTTQLPVHASWGVYARQSTPAQLINHTESTEMQTDDLIDWLVKRGVPQENISLYDADLGMSGTLRIDQRTDLQRLVSDIISGTIQAVMVYQISRLFRDETGVQYNVFADVCRKNNCVLVTGDGMVFNFAVPLCIKMFRMLAEMAADFIPQQIGLLHAARLRKARKGYYVGLGSVPSGFRIDTDRHSPTYKKIIPLPEHKEIVRQLYYRFYEVGADNRIQFFRELEKLPYLFPDFPPDIDQSTVGTNKRRKVPGGYHMTRIGIEAMLCNPVNIGWWIVRGEIISKNLSIRMEIKAKKITEEQAAPQISRLRARLVKLDTSRTELEAKLQTNTTDTTLEKTARTFRAFGTFQDELEQLIATWDKKPFALRQDFVNLFVEKAVIEVVATHWMQLAITWAYPSWQPDKTSIFRQRAKAPFWTEDERELVRRYYPAADPHDRA